MIRKQCTTCGVWFVRNSGSHKYCSICARQKNIDQAVKRNKKYPEKLAVAMRKLHYYNKYGTTIDDYNRLFEQQNGCCAICEKHQIEFNRLLGFDHNHATGEIRGLLCSHCNRFVGRFEAGNIKITDKKLEEKIKNYLQS